MIGITKTYGALTTGEALFQVRYIESLLSKDTVISPILQIILRQATGRKKPKQNQMFGLQKGGLDRELSLPLLSLGSPGQREGDVRQKYPPLGIRMQSPAQGGVRLRRL